MLPAFDYQISQHNDRIRRIEIEARRRGSDGRGDAIPRPHEHGSRLALRRALGAAFARSTSGRAS
jgi:hypothetical protein